VARWLIGIGAILTAIATIVGAGFQLLNIVFPEPISIQRDACVDLIEVLGQSLNTCVQRGK
jgi:hypothetical protein